MSVFGLRKYLMCRLVLNNNNHIPDMNPHPKKTYLIYILIYISAAGLTVEQLHSWITVQETPLCVSSALITCFAFVNGDNGSV